MTTTPPDHSDRILAAVMQNLTSNQDDDCITSVRCNGRTFEIEMSPSYFRNSPETTARYLKYLTAVRNEYEEDDDQDPQEVEDEFQKWLIGIFKPIFLQLAPEVLPSFDPEKIGNGTVKPILYEYLFPTTFCCKLEAHDDVVVPVHTDNSEQLMPPRSQISEELLEDLAPFVPSVRPSTIEVAFTDPGQALARMPTRVLADLDGSGEKTTCFFKGFSRGHDTIMESELEAHLKILRSELAPETRVIRLLGLVQDTDESISGLLLTYVDHDGIGILTYSLQDDTPLQDKERWAAQVRESLQQLHQRGLVWGDAKTDNIMVDKDNNAWIIDLGGGYTPGWVDAELAGTMEGDLQGLERVVEYMFNEHWVPDSPEEK